MLFPRPEPQADARRGPPGATGSLVGGGLTDLINEQGIDTAISIVARNARQSAVNHAADTIDGQRSFRDISRDNHFPFIVARDRGILVARWQFAMQRQQNDTAGFIAMTNYFDGLGDLKSPGHKHQHVTLPA